MTLSENYEKFCEIHLVMLVLFDAINTHGFYFLSRFWISRPRKSAPDFHGVRSPKKRTQSEQIHVLLFFSPCQSSIIDFSQWASGSAATKKAVYEHQIQLVIILHRGNHNPFASICYNPITHLFFRACQRWNHFKIQVLPNASNIPWVVRFGNVCLDELQSNIRWHGWRSCCLMWSQIAVKQLILLNFWATCSEQRLLIFTFLIVGFIRLSLDT